MNSFSCMFTIQKKNLNNTCSLNANFEHVCNHSSPKTVAISLSKKGTVVKNML